MSNSFDKSREYPFILKFLDSFLAELDLRLINCSLVGSHVYGTATKESDLDLLVIVESLDLANQSYLLFDVHKSVSGKSQWDSPKAFEVFKKYEHILGNIDIDLTVRSLSAFKAELWGAKKSIINVFGTEMEFAPLGGDPLSFEVLFLTEKFILFTTDSFSSFVLSQRRNLSILADKELRQAIQKASNIKKIKQSDEKLFKRTKQIMAVLMVLRGGYSKKAHNSSEPSATNKAQILSKWALKSLFHAIRIYMFGILLGTYGFINDWEIANEQLEILMKTEDSAKLDMAFFKNYMLAPKMQEILNNFKEALPNDFASHLTACGYNKEQVKAIKLREDVFGLMGISPYDDFE